MTSRGYSSRRNETCAESTAPSIFALPSPGFETVTYHDEAAARAEDAGLLGWVTGAVSRLPLIPDSKLKK